MRTYFHIILLLITAWLCSGCRKDIFGKPEDVSKAKPQPLVAVDLGLPSGTLWASQNLLAERPWDFGETFCWGETFSRETGNYNKDYSFLNGGKLTAYNFDAAKGVVDNRYILDPEDDAATVILGGEWRMPTIWEVKELVNCCKWTAKTVDNGDREYYHGYIVSSKVNKNYIIIPSYTRKGWFIFGGVSNDRYYWTNCVSGDLNAKAYGGDWKHIDEWTRYSTLCIRPVLARRAPVEQISMKESTISISPGSNHQLTVEFTPIDALDRRISWKSSDETVAYVDSSGDPQKGEKVIALYPGQIQLTGTSPSSGLQVGARVTVTDYIEPELVDMGLPSGTLWADSVIGANDDRGLYFAWGETRPKMEFSEDNYIGIKTDDLSAPYILSPDEDAATVIFGEGWRTPSKDDYMELIDNCIVKQGYPYDSLVSKTNGNAIIFPCDRYILYWTSTYQGEGKSVAFRLDYVGDVTTATIQPVFSNWPYYHGWAIRPVFKGQ